MPRFTLTFEYPGHKGETITGSQTVTRGTIEDAAEHVAFQRALKSIHIRTSNGEAVDRLFTFGPSERVA